MQENKKTLMVKKLGAGETKQVDIFPDTKARIVLQQIGASETMLLTPAPQMGIVFDLDEVLWNQVEPSQMLWAGLPTPVGC